MLALTGIEKSFPGVKALSNVDFEVRAGEVHALVGENGAGKSTLTKIIGGAYTPDGGTITYDGTARRWNDPAAAKAAGIHIIYQEFVLFPHLSVAENIFKGYEKKTAFGLIDHRATRRAAQEVIARLGVRIDVDERAGVLSVADQQMVEIAKALIHDVKLLILDEPTAVLSEPEVELLFDLVRTLRAEGVGVIYISHRLDEIFELCDRVTVLKDGQHVATRPIGETDHDELVSLMVGREIENYFPPNAEAVDMAVPPVLHLRNISVPDRVRNVTLSVQPGEILGLAGLIGAGRTELAHAAFGVLDHDGGEVFVHGQKVDPVSPGAMIKAGVGYVTEDRKGQGLFMNLDVARNVTGASLGEFVSGWMISGRQEIKAAKTEIDNFAIRCRGPLGDVDKLSGGNQQKIIFGRWTRACHAALVLDEPTRGVDVGAKAEIYKIMRNLANEGIGILMISSELQEVVGMSDRVAVMREGRLSGLLEGPDITEENIMHLAAQTDREAA
ncbi:MAG: sugar ABC transporter ATP-binding protein [Roseitalea sp.]|jgi:ABC-type sugar transport system ATPase subunit|nr:sugar ABC transporter ATP-binding protein [Roseitalea sp.]MBO6722111.1 sugar ABC transporter ATP-binding protein [Roseitalea sp.]MBO6741731.1 sugar ABC transporter ATP-binding protein [Roseitalea sp.]